MILYFVCLFGCFSPQSNSYGHGGTVSFFPGKLEQAVNQYFVHLLSLDHRNYFMINLHKSMGPGLDRTCDPWICSQTCICCQTLPTALRGPMILYNFDDTQTYNTPVGYSIFEPRHEISNNGVCATSKGSDQPAHTHSLIRAFASRLNIQ